MSKQLRDYLPLEQKPGKYIKYLGLTLLFCSLITVISFVNSHREWVSYCIRERITQVGYFAEAFPEIIYYGGTIPQFSEILRGHLLIFVLYFGECISLIISFYRSYRNDSQSIYVMKRINDPLEIHRRSLSLPLSGILLGVVTLMAIAALLHLYYLKSTPAEVLPDPLENFNVLIFWRYLI